MPNFIQKSKTLQDSKSGSSITFAAQGQGHYIYITDLSADGDADAIITVSSGGTTIFQEKFLAGSGFEKHWQEEQALQGLENSSVVIAVSAGNYRVNANGFVTP